MRFDHAAASMEPSLRQLWQEAFGDSDAYLDLFFSEYPAADFALVAEENGIPHAALYLLPLTVHCNGVPYSARYVYAVATDPTFRRRGLMRHLLDTAAENAQTDGISMLVTVPSGPELFPYYAACGFQTAFFADVTEKEVEPTPKIVFSETTLAAQRSLRNAFFGKSELYGEWSEDALCYRDRETKLLGGKVLSFTCMNSPAYLAAVPDGETLRITELVSPTVNDVILSSAAACFGCRRVWLRTPGGHTPFAMIRPCGNFIMQPHASTALSLVLD